MNKRIWDICCTAMANRRRSAWFSSELRIAVAVAVAVVAVGVVSCGGGTDSSSASPSPGIRVGGEPPVAVCSGADLSKLTSAVYVSSLGTDGAGCGQTTKTACQTLQQGIVNCAASGCGVIVRHGLYPTSATIVLRDGVDVYGGCRFDGEADLRYRTVVSASPAAGTAAVSATGIDSATTVAGLVVVGKDEAANGTASIAMVVSNSKGLTLTQSVLAAGTGGSGGAGEAPAATAGNPGAAALLAIGGASWSGAGGSGALACVVAGISGGAGGRGADYNHIQSSGCFNTCTCTAIGGTDGNRGDDGAATGGIAGLKGVNGPSCSDSGDNNVALPGQQGGAGAPGACSASAGLAGPVIWGTLDKTIWLPSKANSGSFGDAGGGGGGGGAGGACTNKADYFGFPGGGGGSGGCGGPGGSGGQQGGASLALILDNATLPDLAQQNVIAAGVGGVGGSGGIGSVGGAGGLGGATVGQNLQPACTLSTSNNNESGYAAVGGPGGVGGQGGAGSGGAGGNGGPAVAIALVGTTAFAAGGPGVLPGRPGLGGAGGGGGVNPNCTASQGQSGYGGAAGDIVPMDKPPRSVLTAGQEMGLGLVLTSPNGSTVLSVMPPQPSTQFYNALCVSKAGTQQCQSFGEPFDRPREFLMQPDGNLCWLGSVPRACTNTAGHPGAYLAVRDDGTAAILDGSIVVWRLP